MNRTEFIVATAIVLFVAFLMGWCANWLVHRFVRVPGDDVADLDQMARALHEAEEARDLAQAALRDIDGKYTARINQAEAEQAAAMEGLRLARQETDELRAYIETLNKG